MTVANLKKVLASIDASKDDKLVSVMQGFEGTYLVIEIEDNPTSTKREVIRIG